MAHGNKAGAVSVVPARMDEIGSLPRNKAAFRNEHNNVARRGLLHAMGPRRKREAARAHHDNDRKPARRCKSPPTYTAI